MTLDNGDHLWWSLGDTAVTGANLSIAISAQATQQSVYYQISSTQTVCGQTRARPDWFVVNGSIN